MNEKQSFADFYKNLNQSTDPLAIRIRQGMERCVTEIKFIIGTEYTSIFLDQYLEYLYRPEVNMAAAIRNFVEENFDIYQGSRFSKSFYLFVSYFFYIEAGNVFIHHASRELARDVAWFHYGEANYWLGIGTWIEETELEPPTNDSLIKKLFGAMTRRGGQKKKEKYQKIYDYAYTCVREDKDKDKYRAREKVAFAIKDKVDAYSMENFKTIIQERTLIDYLKFMPDGATYFPIGKDKNKSTTNYQEISIIKNLFKKASSMEKRDIAAAIKTALKISHLIEEDDNNNITLKLNIKALQGDIEELIKAPSAIKKSNSRS